MKRKSLVTELKELAAMIGSYCRQHRACKEAIQWTYTCPWPVNAVPDGQPEIRLTVSPKGCIYQVCQQYFITGKLIRQEVWIATYGWQSSGHLIEIGGDRYCIYNPPFRQLYLEWFDESSLNKQFEVYTAI